MNFSYLSKELFMIERRKAWIRDRVVFKDMVSEQDCVVKAMNKVWVASCLKERAGQSSLGLHLDIVDAKSTIGWGAEKNSFFRFEKLVSINPAFDMAVYLGNVLQSQINTVSSKPNLC